MRHFINPNKTPFTPGTASTFWTVIAVIGFVLRVILELTDPKNEWNRGDD